MVEEEVGGWKDRQTENAGSQTESGGMVVQHDVVPRPGKKKESKKPKTGSTDLTDFTKLQKRDTAERR